MQIKLPQLFWYGGTMLALETPEDWQVALYPMAGAERLAMSSEQIQKAIDTPIGSPPLEDLARGKKKAVIIFDDMTRPTRTHEIAPFVLKALLAAGLEEDQISFVCALGAHGALTAHEFRKKLGRDVVERFRVYNHNCYEHCLEVGTTTRGTKVLINREVAEADIKIGIGCVTAHAQVGFSGGGKIILPGVSHIDTIAHNHIEVEGQARETTGLGNFDHNVMRFNIEEAARLAGLDFKIDAVVNSRGETVGLFAGEFLQAHQAAVQMAKDVCLTAPRPEDVDVVIANACAKPNEMAISLLLGALSLRDFSGPVVIIANAPEGQVVHYLYGRFGQHYGGRTYPVGYIPPSIKLILQAPHLDKTFADWFANPEAVTFTKSWAETLLALGSHIGPHPRVAVLPNATMQYW